MRRRIFGVAVALAMLLSAGMVAAQASSPFSFSITGLRTYWWGIVPTGLDLKLDYRLPSIVSGLDTIAEMTAGAGFEKETFFRDANGNPITYPNYATALTGSANPNESVYDRAQAISDLGLRQGIIYNPALSRNLIEGFLFYRFHYDHYFAEPGSAGGLIFSSPFPDRNQILSNSFMGGLDYDTLQYDKLHKTYQGIYAETSLEWAPGFLFNNLGGADFVRWNFNGKVFKTLYTSTTAKGMNNFSLYAGEFFSADYATGSSVPIYVQQTFGGRTLRFGLGGDAVRGFEVAAWDTKLKMVNSLEIRALGPAILLPSIVPGLYAFFDAGYFNGYYGAPAPATSSGFLASTGVGVYLVSLDLADVTALIAFPVYGQRIDKAPYNISFHFSLHF